MASITQWKVDHLLRKFHSFLSSKGRIISQKIKRKSFSVRKKIQFYEESVDRHFSDKKCRATLNSLAFRLKKLHFIEFEWTSKRNRRKLILEVEGICFINFVNIKILHKIEKKNDVTLYVKRLFSWLYCGSLPYHTKV